MSEFASNASLKVRRTRIRHKFSLTSTLGWPISMRRSYTTDAIAGSGSYVEPGGGSVSIQLPSRILEATGLNQIPQYTGLSSITIQGREIAPSAQYSGNYNSVGILERRQAILSDGNMVVPEYSGQGVLALSHLFMSSSDVTQRFTGELSLNLSHALSSNGLIVLPVYSGSSELTTSRIVTSSSQNITPVYLGQGGFLRSHVISSSSSIILPVYGGSSELSLMRILESDGLLTLPVYSGSSELTTSRIVTSSSQNITPVYSGQGGFLRSHFISSSSSTILPVYGGSSELSLMRILESDGLLILPVYEATSDISHEKFIQASGIHYLSSSIVRAVFHNDFIICVDIDDDFVF